MVLKCKECDIELKCPKTETVDNEYIIRKRKCPKCGLSFKTIEIKEDVYNEAVGTWSVLSQIMKNLLK
jgi:transcriptional regulator NrdR family protein